MHRIALPREIPKRSLVHLRAETCSYVAAKETIKVIARHALMARHLVKDRADIAFTEYLYHSHPLFLIPKGMVNGKLGSFLGRAAPNNAYIYVIAAADRRWRELGLSTSSWTSVEDQILTGYQVYARRPDSDLLMAASRRIRPCWDARRAW
jgi:hypothetical protein